MAKSTAVLARARTALSKDRAKLAAELTTIDRALAALKGVGGRATRKTNRTRRKSKASPKLLAALKKARAARKQKLAEKRAAAS